MKAYVLVKATMGQVEDVAGAICELPGVISADVTFGSYDIIALAEVDSARGLGLLVVRRIQSIPGVYQRTLVWRWIRRACHFSLTCEVSL